MHRKISKLFKPAKPNSNGTFGFHGGLELEPNKRALASVDQQSSIVELSVPDVVTLPLLDYYQNHLEPFVAIGDSVKRGQQLATGLVSPVSGFVQAIDEHDIAHPGGLKAPCVVINNDGHDTLTQPKQLCKDASAQEKLQIFLNNPQHVLEFAGLAGLGGAGFPTATKLNAAIGNLHTLIINAAECEPEIACDEALMQTEPLQIAYGINALIELTQCQQCIVAIEDSKLLAAEKLGLALEEANSTAKLWRIPTVYPTGAQSPLIQTVTGQFIPHNEKPIDHGIVCINVATAFALWRAINGEALDSRVVSLGGTSMPKPCNVRVRFGTPASYVLNQTGNGAIINSHRVRAGGPLSGFDLMNIDSPVTAKTNCILAQSSIIAETKSQPCIRCGQCADVCPANLLPQQLYWYTLADELDKCAKLNLSACIECGCCDLVCPSSIKLTETFRHAKSVAASIETQQQKATDAEQRFAEREQRVLRREQERQAAIAKRKESIKAKKSGDVGKINSALERARQKRKASKDQ